MSGGEEREGGRGGCRSKGAESPSEIEYNACNKLQPVTTVDVDTALVISTEL